MVAFIFLVGRSTIVIAFWTCFSCSSKSSDRGEVTTSLSVSSVENSAAWAIGFRKQRSCLKSNTPNFICWCLRKSPLSSFRKTFRWMSRYFWLSFSIWDQKFSQIGPHFCQNPHSPYKTFCRVLRECWKSYFFLKSFLLNLKLERVYLKQNRAEMIIRVEFTTTENVFLSHSYLPFLGTLSHIWFI